MELSNNLKQAFKEYANVCLEGGFIVDDENSQQFDKIISIFKKNEAIILQGNSGSGKTFMMEVLRRITNPKSKQYFILLDAFQIVKAYNDNYKEIGDKILTEWDDKNILINELGTEEMGIYKSEVMQKFILFRHKLWERTKIKTHFTTNLSDVEIDARYGSFTRSRMFGMCHVIQLGAFEDSTDRRPLKNLKGFPKVEFPVEPDEGMKPTLEWLEASKKYAKENPHKLNTGTEFKGIDTAIKEHLDNIVKKNK